MMDAESIMGGVHRSDAYTDASIFRVRSGCMKFVTDVEINLAIILRTQLRQKKD